MTKPLNPEIKALRAMVRALQPLDATAQARAVEWLHDRTEAAFDKEGTDG